MNYFHLSTLLVLSLCCHKLTALAAHSLLRKDAKQVLILGEHHSHESEPFTQQTDDLLRALTSTCLEKTLPIIIEYDEPSGKNEVLQSYAIKRFLEGRASNTQINVIPYEPRGTISSFLEGLKSSLSKIVKIGTTTHDLCQFYVDKYGQDPAYQQQLELIKPLIEPHLNQEVPADRNDLWLKARKELSKIPCSYSVTLQEYFTYLAANRETMEHSAHAYSDQKGLAEYFSEKLLIYDSAVQSLKNFFGDALEKDLSYILLNKLEKCITIEERFELFETYVTLMHDQTDYVFADFCFIDKLLETLKTDDAVVFLVGAFHERALRSALEKLGYSVIRQEDLFIIIELHLASLLVSPETGPDNVLLHTVKTFLEPLTSKNNHCGACKQHDKQLYACSRCKEVSYCSKKCQGKDWKKHKQTCSSKTKEQ